jgi:hypothetical protein
MQDEDDRSRGHDLVKPSVYITDVVVKTAGSGRRIARASHADQIGREASAGILHVRNDIPPQVGRRRISMQKYDRRTMACIHKAHPAVENRYETSRPGIIG